MVDPEITELLQACRNNFGQAPRNFGLWTKWTYLHVPRPDWLQRNRLDTIDPLFREMPEIYRNGNVVWGATVQANALMFEPGPDSCPGAVVFDPNPDADTDPDELLELGPCLHHLRDETPDDPAAAAIGEVLDAEFERPFGWKVPPTLAPNGDVRLSTIFFVRKHIPGGVLRGRFFPLVVLPKPPYRPMMLPSRYWPKLLLHYWARE